MSSAIYLHYPFCTNKCSYCDFYSIAGGPEGWRRQFTTTLLKELNLRKEEVSLLSSPVTSVYFGGGTPSLMDPHEVFEILEAIRGQVHLSSDAEITLETNPGTVDAAKLKGFYDAGINRLSVGVQSFHPELLKFLDRIHSVDDVIKTVTGARAAGFDNLSLDLIHGIPGQSPAMCEKDLSRALELAPDHISNYCLTYEEKTPLWQRRQAREVKEVSEEDQVREYELIHERLEEAGFEHYEISNYAKPGHASLHNLTYWRYGSYLGLGPGAVSFLHLSHPDLFGYRWKAIANIQKYLQDPRQGEKEEISQMTARQERVMMGLRMKEGLKRDVMDVYQVPLDSKLIESFQKEGFIVEDPETLRLTPAGWLIANELILSLTQ